MKFTEGKLSGAWIIDVERLEDERGFFALAWSKKEFEDRGLDTNTVQTNLSFNRKRGTLRGMHFQIAPYEQPKLVRCTMGAIYDVIVDIRPGSATYRQWLGAELTAENRRMLYVPGGFAHGFQTLVDDVEMTYQMSQIYHPDSARGYRWNDPAFSIKWPLEVAVITPRDANYSDFG